MCTTLHGSYSSMRDIYSSLEQLRPAAAPGRQGERRRSMPNHPQPLAHRRRIPEYPMLYYPVVWREHGPLCATHPPTGQGTRVGSLHFASWWSGPSASAEIMPHASTWLNAGRCNFQGFLVNDDGPTSTHAVLLLCTFQS